MDWNISGCYRHAESAKVTPFVGVWIETLIGGLFSSGGSVTPFVGVWIETKVTTQMPCVNYVTPFVGVWIETAEESDNS